ncbi:MAG: carboxymuconolactone decarboxylase family protein [Alphaproteobacteria bacterium]|nr:carboxymuconolactone decarboxylase family protein [Alphaproteobacteria bacterium]
MAKLPDPTESLKGGDLKTFEHMARARAHAEGRAQLGEVYVRMFNNPGVATKIGALGEHLRFHATLPDAVRELVILRFAARQASGYEWSHHQRPAKLAGISQDVIDELTAGEVPDVLPDASQAILQAVDAVVAKQSIPDDIQQRIVAVHGVAGVVEVVALCGLYGIMSYMVFAFDIPLEEGLPEPPDLG